MLKAKSSEKIPSPAPNLVLHVKVVIPNPIAQKNLRGDIAPRRVRVPTPEIFVVV